MCLLATTSSCRSDFTVESAHRLQWGQGPRTQEQRGEFSLQAHGYCAVFTRTTQNQVFAAFKGIPVQTLSRPFSQLGNTRILLNGSLSGSGQLPRLPQQPMPWSVQPYTILVKTLQLPPFAVHSLVLVLLPRRFRKGSRTLLFQIDAPDFGDRCCVSIGLCFSRILFPGAPLPDTARLATLLSTSIS